LLSLTAQI